MANNDGTILGDIEIAEQALIAIATEVAAFDPVLAPYLALAVAALQGLVQAEEILLSPAVLLLYNWFLTLVSNKSVAGQAYVAAAQSAFADGFAINSPEAKAKYPILAMPFPASVM